MDEPPKYESRRNSGSSNTNDIVDLYSTLNKFHAGGQPNFNPTVIRKRSPLKYSASDASSKPNFQTYSSQPTPNTYRKMLPLAPRHVNPMNTIGSQPSNAPNPTHLQWMKDLSKDLSLNSMQVDK